MYPDDAADLIAELPPETAERAARADGAGGGRGRPAADVLRREHRRRDDDLRAGDPRPDATIADALAHVRNPDLTPALAALVYVCRPPLETPTGQFLGVAHIQRLLREPPSTLVAGALDDSMENLRPEATIDEVAAHLATYNLVARARRRRERPPARRGDRRRPARPHAPGELARPRRPARPAQVVAMAESAPAGARLDTPRDDPPAAAGAAADVRRGLLRHLRRAVRALHGHRAVPDLHDRVRRHLGALEHPRSRGPGAGTTTPSSS